MAAGVWGGERDRSARLGRGTRRVLTAMALSRKSFFRPNLSSAAPPGVAASASSASAAAVATKASSIVMATSHTSGLEGEGATWIPVGKLAVARRSSAATTGFEAEVATDGPAGPAMAVVAVPVGSGWAAGKGVRPNRAVDNKQPPLPRDCISQALKPHLLSHPDLPCPAGPRWAAKPVSLWRCTARSASAYAAAPQGTGPAPPEALAEALVLARLATQRRWLTLESPATAASREPRCGPLNGAPRTTRARASFPGGAPSLPRGLHAALRRVRPHQPFVGRAPYPQGGLRAAPAGLLSAGKASPDPLRLRQPPRSRPSPTLPLAEPTTSLDQSEPAPLCEVAWLAGRAPKARWWTQASSARQLRGMGPRCSLPWRSVSVEPRATPWSDSTPATAPRLFRMQQTPAESHVEMHRREH